eukprot:gene3485-3980_t
MKIKPIPIDASALQNLLFTDDSDNTHAGRAAPMPVPSENTAGMTLQFVQILVRHGDRTPLYNPLTVPNDTWNCSLSYYMLPSLQDTEVMDTPSRMFRKTYLPNRNYWPGNCSDGQLTQLGFEQHLQVGSVFRELYVNKYQLLSPTLDLSEIWVRSTDVPRTLQSAQAEITAMYPPSAAGGASSIDVVEIHTMDSYYENMSPNTDLCPALNNLYQNITTEQAYISFVTKMSSVQQQIMTALELTGSAPDWSSFMDLFFAIQCHDFELPAGIDQSIVDSAYQAAIWEMEYQLSFPMIARLGMSTFLEEIVDNFRMKMDGNITQKLMFFSGHDDSVGPFVNLFGFLNEWPPYASHVELELWTDSNNDYFLQFKYNGVVHTLPGCSGVMCPIDTFFNLAYEILIPDYYDACHQSDFHKVYINKQANKKH